MTKRIKPLGELSVSGCFVAGGAVLSRVTKSEIADYDLYPKSKESAISLCAELLDQGAYVVNLSDRAITFKHNKLHNKVGERVIIQVMTFDTFETPEKIFEFFDFSVCMGAFDCDSEEYTFHEDFWPDVTSKTLRFNPKTNFPLASLIRTQKYNTKGYVCGKGEMAKVALAVADRGLPESWEDLETLIGGVYGKALKLDAGEEEFTLEKAYEVLGDLEVSLVEDFEEDWGFIKEDTLEMIFSEDTYTIYETNNLQFVVKGEALVTAPEVDSGLEEFLGDRVSFKPLSESPVKYLVAYKQLTKTSPEEYIGGVWTGNHNGVTYSPFQKTCYDKEPYLFSYQNPKYLQKGKPWAEVKIPVEDLVDNGVFADAQKYTSKSMILGEIND